MKITEEMVEYLSALARLSLPDGEKAAMTAGLERILGYMDVLDAQRQLFDSEIAVNDAILTEFTATVSLYKALGGGLER